MFLGLLGPTSAILLEAQRSSSNTGVVAHASAAL